MVDPRIVRTASAQCRVELTPGDDYGRTVYEFNQEPPDLAVGLDADPEAFLRFLTDALG